MNDADPVLVRQLDGDRTALRRRTHALLPPLITASIPRRRCPPPPPAFASRLCGCGDDVPNYSAPFESPMLSASHASLGARVARTVPRRPSGQVSRGTPGCRP